MRTLQVGFIGCGGFARGMHIPLVLAHPAYRIRGTMDIDREAAKSTMESAKADYFTTDVSDILEDRDIDVVFITTRHDSHADLSIRAAEARKHILCEKPMALRAADCRRVAEAVSRNGVKYTIGYNRGLAPLIVRATELLQESTGKKKMVYHRIQAHFPAEHWTHQAEVGGGRFVGEGCHIFDLFCQLIQAEPVSIYAAGGIFLDPAKVTIPDSACVTITFEDGSVCTTLINSAGCPDFEKEVTEIYCDNKVMFIDSFRRMEAYGFEGRKKTILDIGGTDKGQAAEVNLFARSILEDTSPPNGILAAARAAVISYKVNQSLATCLPIPMERKEYDFR